MARQTLPVLRLLPFDRKVTIRPLGGSLRPSAGASAQWSVGLRWLLLLVCCHLPPSMIFRLSIAILFLCGLAGCKEGPFAPPAGQAKAAAVFPQSQQPPGISAQ